MVTGNVLVCIVILLASISPTECDSVLHVAPSQIIQGISEFLEVNCSLHVGTVSNMDGLVSLILSRANGSGQNFTELAGISEFSPTAVTVVTSEDVTTTGFLDQDGESFLHLRWELPTNLQGGVYQCTAQGFDTFGHIAMSTSVHQVMINEANIQDYIDKVVELRKNLEEALQSCEKVPQCSTDYLQSSYLSYDDHEYYISADYFSHIYASLDTCSRCGGYLVEIDDEQEYLAIQTYLNTHHTDFDKIVIAGSDEYLEGFWVLQSSQHDLPLVDWAPGFPTTGDNTHDCLYLYGNYQWRMWDFNCFGTGAPASATRYMCEIPRPTSNP